MINFFKKQKWFLVLSIISFLVLMSLIFFWYGNHATGIFMISLPALALTISTCCYMVNNKQQVNDVIDAAHFIDVEDESAARQRNLDDRPPSYRMTWRRSFMKRFKNRGESRTPADTEMGSTLNDTPLEAGNTQNEHSEFHDLPKEGTYPASTGENQVVGTSSIKRTERNSSEHNSVEAGQECGSSEADSAVIARQESLPTYDQAIEIIRSRGDLTTI